MAIGDRISARCSRGKARSTESLQSGGQGRGGASSPWTSVLGAAFFRTDAASRGPRDPLWVTNLRFAQAVIVGEAFPCDPSRASPHRPGPARYRKSNEAGGSQSAHFEIRTSSAFLIAAHSCSVWPTQRARDEPQPLGSRRSRGIPRVTSQSTTRRAFPGELIPISLPRVRESLDQELQLSVPL